MGKQKTVFVWILLVLLGIYLISGIIGTVIGSLFRMLFLRSIPLSYLDIIFQIISIMNLVLVFILFFKLYNVKPDVVKWVHISFGFVVIVAILSLIYDLVSGVSNIADSIYLIVLTILEIAMWIGITLHLKRAQRENLMDFS